MHFNNGKLHIFIFCLSILFSSVLIAKEGDVLKIAGWDVYADPEQTNKTIGYKSFEQSFNIKIHFTPLSNLDDIVSAAESNQKYDIYIISNEGIRLLHDMSLVKPLNLDLLANYQNLHHSLKYSEWSQFEGRVYAVPWAWGPTGLIYDKNIVSEPDSWNTLWDPKYTGKVAMWDDVSMIWTTALSLGYKNVYNLTKTQLAAVKDKLYKFNDLKAIYYSGVKDEITLSKQGKLVAFNSWYDPSTLINSEGRNFAMTIPKEGAVGMFDSYMLSIDSKQINLAHEFINHQISPAIQYKMINITGLAPSNIETLRLLTPAKIKALHLDEPDYFNRMLLWDHMARKNLYDDVLRDVRNDLNNKKKNK